MTDPAHGPTTEELRARALGRTATASGGPRPPLLPRPCLACNREQGESMCDLCQRLEVAEAAK